MLLTTTLQQLLKLTRLLARVDMLVFRGNDAMVGVFWYLRTAAALLIAFMPSVNFEEALLHVRYLR